MCTFQTYQNSTAATSATQNGTSSFGKGNDCSSLAEKIDIDCLDAVCFDFSEEVVSKN